MQSIFAIRDGEPMESVAVDGTNVAIIYEPNRASSMSPFVIQRNGVESPELTAEIGKEFDGRPYDVATMHEVGRFIQRREGAASAE